jgi:hypothetical protein
VTISPAAAVGLVWFVMPAVCASGVPRAERDGSALLVRDSRGYRLHVGTCSAESAYCPELRGGVCDAQARIFAAAVMPTSVTPTATADVARRKQRGRQRLWLARYAMSLEFEWDPSKAEENLKKHGVGFDEALTVFADPSARIFDA